MGRRLRDLETDDGASLIEYGLAVALIGLVAVVVTSLVGSATSGIFDQVGGAFPAESLVAAPDLDPSSDAFDELFERIEGIDSLGASLTGKAEEAEKRFLKGDVDGAVAKLNSLLKEVDAQQGKQLSFDEAASVRNAAERLIDSISTG
jgi:Flp pilus assembly pilin Flp